MTSNNSMSSKKNYKIVLLGDSGVGKTALIQRYAHNRYQQKQSPTIGIDFVGKNVNLKGHTYRLQLWDTAGQQRYRSLIPSYLKDALSAIFIYDITRPDTLNNLQVWIRLFKQSKTDKTILIACGNKDDLKQKQNYDETVLSLLLDKYKMKSFKVSALNGNGVNDMFQKIVQQIHNQQQKKKKRFDQNLQISGPISSQILFKEEIKSHRSQRQAEKQKEQNHDLTNVKLSKIHQNVQQDKGKKISSEIPGQNRCC